MLADDCCMLARCRYFRNRLMRVYVVVDCKGTQYELYAEYGESTKGKSYTPHCVQTSVPYSVCLRSVPGALHPAHGESIVKI